MTAATISPITEDVIRHVHRPPDRGQRRGGLDRPRLPANRPRRPCSGGLPRRGEAAAAHL